jgi:hypothetical protein
VVVGWELLSERRSKESRKLPFSSLSICQDQNLTDMTIDSVCFRQIEQSLALTRYSTNHHRPIYD